MCPWFENLVQRDLWLRSMRKLRAGGAPFSRQQAQRELYAVDDGGAELPRARLAFATHGKPIPR